MGIFLCQMGGGYRLFACLEIIPPAYKGIRGLFSLPRTRTELFSARALGAEFLWLEAGANRKGKPDWETVAQLVRPMTRQLLVPVGCEIPQHLGLEQPVCPAFERKVLLQLACDLISNTRMPLYRRMLGIYDPEGVLAQELLFLLRHYTAVRVVTGNRPVYQRAVDQAMEALGAPVLLGEDPSDFADCVLLLCPGDVCQSLPLLPACPVLAGGIFADFQGCNVFSAPRMSMGGEPLSQLPGGIDAHAFGGAVFGNQGYLLPELRLQEVLVNGRISSPEEAKRIMLREAGYVAPP